MTRLLFLTLCLLIFAIPASAEIYDHPGYTFLSCEFGSVRVIDSFALASTARGVALLTLDNATGLLTQSGHLSLSTEPLTIKIRDDVAVILSKARLVYFADISNLPSISLLGQADLGIEFNDIDLVGQDIYVAAGYNGIRHYRMTGYNDPIFADSSLAGVHCVQMDIDNDTLYALDDYNGILRYDLSSSDLEHFVDLLAIPSQPRAFVKHDSTVVVSLEDRQQLLIGDYSGGTGSIVDTISILSHPVGLFAIDSFIVTADASNLIVERVNLNSGEVLSVAMPPTTNIMADGGTYHASGEATLLLPDDESALTTYDIDQMHLPDNPHPAYERPGPITDLHVQDGVLMIGGVHNPLESYFIDTSGQAIRQDLLPGLRNATSIVSARERTLAFYPEIGTAISMLVTRDSIEILHAYDGIGDDVTELRFYEQTPSDTLDLLLSIGQSQITLSAVTNDWIIIESNRINVIGNILDVVFVDSLLVFSTDNWQAYGYRVDEDLQAYHHWTIATPDQLDNLVLCTDQLLGFGSRDMYRVDVLGTEQPKVNFLGTLPVDVEASTVVGDILLTIGELGIGVFDTRYDIPQLLDFGGYGGSMIAATSNHIAISDGNAVYLYPYDFTLDSPTDIDDEPLLLVPGDFSLRQNYPNPFNPTTTIVFNLSRASDVKLSVFNLLGQEVVSLLDASSSAGEHAVLWGGTDRNGNEVASGTYFYRLETEQSVETRKMILLK